MIAVALPVGWELVLWMVLIGAIVNSSCAILGCYLVLRRLSLLGDAISHAVLPGIALAFLLTGRISGLPIVIGAMALGLLTSFLTQLLTSVGRVREDASMGVVFTGLFAIGVLMITHGAQHVDLDPGCVLYGFFDLIPLDTIELLGMRMPRAMTTLGPTLVMVVVFVALLWKELKIASFDPALATSMGINALTVHYLLMAMVAGATVAAFEAVGSILPVAMLIVPAAAAHMLSDRLRTMIVWAVVIAVASSVLGVAAGTWLNTTSAGTMAVAAGLLFAAAVMLAPRRGLVSRWLHQLALAIRIAGEDILADLYRAGEAEAAGEPALQRTLLAESRRRAAGLRGWLAQWRLRWQGYVGRTPDGELFLLPAGRQAARSIVRSHRLWERYLEEYFELPLDHLHEAAERMEHFIGPTLQSELASQVHSPHTDPHGRAIPDNSSPPA